MHVAQASTKQLASYEWSASRKTISKLPSSTVLAARADVVTINVLLLPQCTPAIEIQRLSPYGLHDWGFAKHHALRVAQSSCWTSQCTREHCAKKRLSVRDRADFRQQSPGTI
eukprot:6254396-Amphidinium_carterae.1